MGWSIWACVLAGVGRVTVARKVWTRQDQVPPIVAIVVESSGVVVEAFCDEESVIPITDVFDALCRGIIASPVLQPAHTGFHP